MRACAALRRASDDAPIASATTARMVCSSVPEVRGSDAANWRTRVRSSGDASVSSHASRTSLSTVRDTTRVMIDASVCDQANSDLCTKASVNAVYVV